MAAELFGEGLGQDEITGAPHSIQELLGPTGKRARLARLHLAQAITLASTNMESEPGIVFEFLLNLFPPEKLAQTITSNNAQAEPIVLNGLLNSKTDQMGMTTLSGYVLNAHNVKEIASSFEIIFDTESALINVMSIHGIFEAKIFAKDTDIYVIREIDQNKLGVCGVGMEDWRKDNQQKKTALSSGLEKKPIKPREGTAQISVLVAYTEAAKKKFGGAPGIKKLILSAVNQANLAFQNSNVPAKLVDVNVYEAASYIESAGRSGFYTMLAHLCGFPNKPELLEDVRQLRKNFNSDLVCLIVDNNSLGGLANVMDQVSSDFGKKAYCVVSADNANRHSFVHELAHTMGCAHDANDPPGAFSYAKGYVFSCGRKKFGTIMAKRQVDVSRIGLFSSPDLVFKNGAYTCQAGTQENDNVRVLRQTVWIAEKFGDRPE